MARLETLARQPCDEPSATQRYANDDGKRIDFRQEVRAQKFAVPRRFAFPECHHRDAKDDEEKSKEHSRFPSADNRTN